MTTKTKTALDTAQDMIDESAEVAHNVVARSAASAEEMIDSTRRKAGETQASVQAGLRQVRDAVPVTLNRAATRVEELARAGIDKARTAGSTVANKAHEAGERTADYVRQEPAKALLFAAAAGAAATLLVSWATRRRTESGYRL